MKKNILHVIVASLLTLLVSRCSIDKDVTDINEIRSSYLSSIIQGITEKSNEEKERLTSADNGLSIEVAIIDPSSSLTDKAFEIIKKVVHENWYNETLKEHLTTAQFQRLEELRVKYGYIKSDTSKPFRGDDVPTSKIVLWIVLGSFILFVVNRFYLRLRDHMNRITMQRNEEKQHLLKIEYIKNLTKEDILKYQGNLSSTTIELEAAIKMGLVKIVSLTGISIREALIELSLIDKQSPETIVIPLGTTFVSDGSHQTMVIRENHIIELADHLKLKVPVTCTEFNKTVPNSSNVFIMIGSTTPKVQAVLNVSKAAQVDWFVTQLAVWQVTDNIHPSRIELGSTIDKIEGKSRKGTEFEIELCEEIINKAALL